MALGVTVLCVGARCQRAEEGPSQAADGLNLCYPCRGHLGDNALKAARLYEDLALVLTGGGSKAERVSGTRDSVGLNLDDTAADERDTIWRCLSATCATVAGGRGVAVPQETVISMALFVRTHADWLARQDCAGDVSAELADAAWRGRRVAYRKRSDAVFIGECPMPPEDRLCPDCGGHGLTGRQHPDTPHLDEVCRGCDGAGYLPFEPCGERLYVTEGAIMAVECRGCGTIASVGEWLQRMGVETGAQDTAENLAASLSATFGKAVDRNVVRNWWRRGKVLRVGVDGRNRPLYDSAAVLAYAESLWSDKESAA